LDKLLPTQCGTKYSLAYRERDVNKFLFLLITREAPGYHIHFTKNCPEEIKNKVLELYPKLIEETKRRHEEGLYTSKDYFF